MRRLDRSTGALMGEWDLDVSEIFDICESDREFVNCVVGESAEGEWESIGLVLVSVCLIIAIHKERGKGKRRERRVE